MHICITSGGAKAFFLARKNPTKCNGAANSHSLLLPSLILVLWWRLVTARGCCHCPRLHCKHTRTTAGDWDSGYYKCRHCTEFSKKLYFLFWDLIRIQRSPSILNLIFKFKLYHNISCSIRFIKQIHVLLVQLVDWRHKPDPAQEFGDSS